MEFEEDAYTPDTEEEKRRVGVWLWRVLIALLLALAVFLGHYAWVSYHDNKDTPMPVPTSTWGTNPFDVGNSGDSSDASTPNPSSSASTKPSVAIKNAKEMKALGVSPMQMTERVVDGKKQVGYFLPTGDWVPASDIEKQGYVSPNSGSDYGDDDPKLGQEPSVEEAKAQVKPAPDKVYQRYLSIPSIGVHAPVVKGTTSGSNFYLPYSIWSVAASTTAAGLEANVGSTVLSGHVGAGSIPGVFHDLSTVKRGSTMQTVDRTGKKITWRVQSISVVGANKVSSDYFTKSGPRYLVLITCAGKSHYVGGHREYPLRVIVTATPV